MTLGQKIHFLREKRNMSQRELAGFLGVTVGTVAEWEADILVPSIGELPMLSKLLGVSADELLSAAKSLNTIREERIPIPTLEDPVTSPVPINHFITNSSHIEPLPETTRIVPPRKNHKFLMVFVMGVVLFLIALFFVSGLVSGWDANETAPLTAEEIYTKISPSVVEIIAEGDNIINTGTGFFFDNEGTVVTNYHVIENCQTAKIATADGFSYNVTSVIGYDVDRDVAFLSTNCKNTAPLSIRKVSVKTGEKVYALGSSLGLTGSLSDGIVSAVNRVVEGNIYIQTTAPISQGNSGGPLVDETGAVVGIVCASFTDGQNLNLAIPISELNSIPLDSWITLGELFDKPKREVEWLSDYRFIYYTKENTYVLLFQLSDKNKVPMSAAGTVKIRIVNCNNVTVYSKSHNFTSANFEDWVYDDVNEMYLATIYISPSSIDTGATEYGMVYFEVYGIDYTFDECSIEARNLPINTLPSIKPTKPIEPPTTPIEPSTTPIEPSTTPIEPSTPVESITPSEPSAPTEPEEIISIQFPQTPLYINTINYNIDTGEYGISHTVRIDSFSYEFDYFGQLNLYCNGEKTYDIKGSDSTYFCELNWRLYDTNGYLIDSGWDTVGSLKVGDKFKKHKINIGPINITPGESYILEVYDSSYE